MNITLHVTSYHRYTPLVHLAAKNAKERSRIGFYDLGYLSWIKTEKSIYLNFSSVIPCFNPSLLPSSFVLSLALFAAWR